MSNHPQIPRAERFDTATKDALARIAGSDGVPSPLPSLLGDVKTLAFTEVHRRLEREGVVGIRDSHGCVFRYIEAGGSRLTDLAERSGLTKQAVGEIVDDLERSGHVERVPDPADGRAKIIRLTELGWQAFESAVRVFDAIEREWAERFGAERVAVLRSVLEEIAAGASAAPDSAPAGSREPAAQAE